MSRESLSSLQVRQVMSTTKTVIGKSSIGEPLVFTSPRYEYTYTSLEDIAQCGHSQVHVYGVVKSCTSVRKSRRGTSYYKTVYLHNQILYSRQSTFTVCLFANINRELPCCGVGDVLRVNHVVVEPFNSSVNGKVQMFLKGCWLLFKQENTTTSWDSSSKPHPCWNDSEGSTVKELLAWSRGLLCSDEPNNLMIDNTSEKVSLSVDLGPQFNSTATTSQGQTTPHVPSTKATSSQGQTTPHSSREEASSNVHIDREAVAIGDDTQQCNAMPATTDLCPCENNNILSTLTRTRTTEANYVGLSHVLCRAADGIYVSSLTHNLHIRDAPVKPLNTKLLVNELPYFPLHELHSILTAGAPSCAPFICRTSCYILPIFQCKQLRSSEGLGGRKGFGESDTVLYVSLADPLDPSVTVSAAIYQSSLLQLFGMDSPTDRVTDVTNILSNLVPPCKMGSGGITIDCVNSAGLILEMYRGKLCICYTRLVI